MTARRIIFVIFDGLQPIDLVGPHEVFSYAGMLSPDGEYRCQVAARAAGPVRTRSGLLVHAGHSVFDLGPAGIDTIVVAGGTGADTACRDRALVDWLAVAGRAARRVTSVCTGVFPLAAAGLAEGRRVTCHWSRAGQLAAEHPGVTVDADPIFIRDGRIWTSAGVTAGMDLALALVEDDLGPLVARDVARYLVLYLRRPGSQSQFSVLLVPGGAGAREGVTNAALTGWIRDTAAKATWVTSVCTGAALLHEAGPARGKLVATHHAYEDALAARGDVTVVRDARYVVDGNLVTSQGVSAGIDMALWLVGRIHGRPHARAVRRYLQYDPAPPYLADEPLI
jgi:transcriptional regulator GlxA family with amidase domain